MLDILRKAWRWKRWAFDWVAFYLMTGAMLSLLIGGLVFIVLTWARVLERFGP